MSPTSKMPSHARSIQNETKLEVSTSEKLKRLGDCRPYSKSFNTPLLKFKTTSINPVGGKGMCAQINTICRCQHYFSENHFKRVHHTTISLMFKHTALALSNKKIFLHYKEDYDWPSELQNLQRNLLCTTLLEVDLIECSKNDSFISKRLLEAF